jgi:two-component sensor histidine kinase
MLVMGSVSGDAGRRCLGRSSEGAHSATGRAFDVDVGEEQPADQANFDVTRAATLGLQLVRSLTRQLRGRLDGDDDGCARFTITGTLPTTTFAAAKAATSAA